MVNQVIWPNVNLFGCSASMLYYNIVTNLLVKAKGLGVNHWVKPLSRLKTIPLTSKIIWH